MKLETKEEYLVDSAIEMLYPTVTFNSYEAAVKHIHETPGTWRITKIYRTLPVGAEGTCGRYQAKICEDGNFRDFLYAMSLKRLKRKCEKYAKRERKAIAYVATLKEES